MRDEGHPVVVVDSGDVFGESSLTGWLRAETAVDGMSLMAYDAMGLGDSEFRFGLDGLDELLARGSFQAVSSNVRHADTGAPYVQPSLTIQAGTVRVAVLSAVTAGLVPIQALDDGHGRVLEVSDATEALLSELTAVRGDVEVVVVLAHVGVDGATALASTLGEADILVASHAGPYLAQPFWSGDTLITATGLRGQFVGRLDIRLDELGVIQTVTGGPVILNENIPDDPAAAQLYQDYLARVESAIDEILASIPEQDPPSGSAYVGQAVCVSCHAAQASQWQTTRHAGAFASLTVVNQDFNPDCTVCHTTGFGYVGGFRLESLTPGMINVQCESCHGAGADHAADPQPGFGLTSESTCRNCHDEDHVPDWDYATALPQVLHQ